jgi:hypothetical protein
MAHVVGQTERLVAARPQRVHAFLAYYRNNRPRILLPSTSETTAWSKVETEQTP